MNWIKAQKTLEQAEREMEDITNYIWILEKNRTDINNKLEEAEKEQKRLSKIIDEFKNKEKEAQFHEHGINPYFEPSIEQK